MPPLHSETDPPPGHGRQWALGFNVISLSKSDRRGPAVGSAIYGRGSAIRKGRSPSRENGINGAQGWSTFFTEAARIQRAQNQESAAIQNSKHNDVTGNPSSPSSQRMQADVQRNINQQNRVEQGIQSEQLTNKEVSNLERGQSRVNRAEARAGSNGHVGPREQGRIQRLENRQSNKIFREKHNNRVC